MSEYQYYEFLAIDQPLTEEQMEAVRRFSTRAEITPTSFVNEYHWGSFKGNIDSFMAKYYDAFLYFANWGTHEFRLRVPRACLDVDLARQYCPSDQARVRLAGEFVVLGWWSEDDSGDWDGESPSLLSGMVPLRADLLSGDLRSLYLGWLACAAGGELEEDDFEPPVPPGLGALSASLTALADFLRIDDSLIEAAARASAPLPAREDSDAKLSAWIAALPAGEKDTMLVRTAQGSAAAVQRELSRRFRQAYPPAPLTGEPGVRTVGELLREAERVYEDRQRLAAEKEAREEALRQAQAARALEQRLDALAGREPQAWQEVDTLIATRLPASYDQAVQLLQDLRALAERDGRPTEAASRIRTLRESYKTRSGLIRRLNAAAS